MNRSDDSRVALAFSALLLTFVLLAIAFNVVHPLGEAPDEASHFGVIRNYIRWGLLQGGREHEAFQPPLYYLIGSFIARPFDLREGRLWRNPDFSIEDPDSPPNLLIHTAAEDWPFASWVWAWHVLRLYSTVCVLIGLLTTWQLARLSDPAEPLTALIAVALIGLAPGVLFIAAAVNNDNLTFTLAALALWQTARIAIGNSTRHDWFLLGTLIGAGYATKLNLLTLITPAFVVWYGCARKHLTSAREAIIQAGYATLGVTAASGWWTAYLWLNRGELLGLESTWQFNPPREGDIAWTDWMAIFQHTWQSYWLKYLRLQQPAWIYNGLLLLPLLAGLGWIRSLRSRQVSADHRILAILAVQASVTFLAWILWTINVPGTDQARLFAPAYPAVAILVAVGLARVWTQPPIRTCVIAVLCVGLTALSVWTVFGLIRSHFAPPLTKPADPTPPQVVFGGELGLNYTVVLEAVPLQIGQRIYIDTEWQALAPIRRDLWVQFKLQPERGDPVVVDFGSPSRGVYSTDRWPLGRVIHARHTIIIPEVTRPGIYRLIISVRPPDQLSWLPVLVNGHVLGEELVLTEVTVAVS